MSDENKDERPLGFDTRSLPAGVTPDMVRLSVGIEDVDDIVADLERAIESATN